MGVQKLRITGGEPLVRKGILTFFEAMSRHLADGTLKELTVTPMARSCDGMRQTWLPAACGDQCLARHDGPQKFAAITRWGRLAQVLDGGSRLRGPLECGSRSMPLR